MVCDGCTRAIDGSAAVRLCCIPKGLLPLFDCKHVMFLSLFSATNSVGNLFHMAGQVGKAVGTLVTVMTDEEGSGTDEEYP